MSQILFQHARAIVFHGRWQDLGLGLKSVDVTLTDPPFTEHVHANVRSCATNGPVKVQKYELKFDALTDYDHVQAQLAVTRRWVLNFCALEQLGAYEAAAGGPYKLKGAYIRSGIWRKQQAAPQLSGDRPANSCEGWALMHAKRKTGRLYWTGHGQHAYLSSHEDDVGANFYAAPDAVDETAGVPDFIEAGRERAKKRHPAQKPAALCDRLAKWFVPHPTAPIHEQIVLDGYAGSGSLGFAALRLGATVIFCDVDREWADFLAAEVQFYLENQEKNIAVNG